MKKYYLVSLSVVLLFALMFAFVGLALTFLYPVKFKPEIMAASEEFGIDASVIASVINVESGYRSGVVSNAGAIGLMQLMPDTAIEISQKLGDNDFKINDLYVPATNIRYGAYYLSYLNRVYEGNLTNVLAGYNAGLGKTNYWLGDQQYSENGTIVSTPYTETNNFIKRVKKNQKVYKQIYGKQQNVPF